MVGLSVRLPMDGESVGCAEIAQLVEQGTENPRVDGSIPPLGTTVEVNDNGTGV